jgi:hypothetical protein
MLALTEELIEIVRRYAAPIPPPARSRFYELVDRKLGVGANSVSGSSRAPAPRRRRRSPSRRPPTSSRRTSRRRSRPGHRFVNENGHNRTGHFVPHIRPRSSFFSEKAGRSGRI